jgi:peptidoglycan/xylan/chitin deacetylase (PgdA/CDA1 family)
MIPFLGATPIDVFEGQMRFISRYYRVVSLADLVAHLDSGSSDIVLAITFDDGYRDNRTNAFPVLERYGLPATIFLATESIDSGEPLWFERLAAALKLTTCEFIDVEWDIPRRFWLRTPAERLAANKEIFSALRQMTNEARAQQLACVLDALGRHEDASRDRPMLNWDEIRWMHQRGIDFGGHTVTHPYLSRLTGEQMDWEVRECKRRIESELQAPVRHFAYPNGQEADFTASSKSALRDAGYEAAVTTLWGLNYATTDRFELRRGVAWEHDEAVFAGKMDWYHLIND